jgi:hypothetical protein
MRTIRSTVTLSCALTLGAHAQAPAAGPLALLLSPSVRSTAVGDAWVTRRDDFATFYNPALIGPTDGIGISFARYDGDGTMGALASAVTIGPITFGWGAEFVQFKADETPGSRDASSLAAVTGANFLFKDFRLGLGMKYAEDQLSGVLGSPISEPIHHGVLLGDLGIAHRLFAGTAGLSVENIGNDRALAVPLETAVNWVRPMQTDVFDFAVGARVAERNRWVGGGGGVEAGYGWIEGYSVTLRAGAQRPEVITQRPMSVGGTFNADRLVLDYALEFFDGNRYAHHIAIRWH